MSSEQEQVKQEIAHLYAQREQLKQQLESKQIKARDGFERLEKIDAQLSLLDSRFKQLWDHANAK